MKYLGHFVLVSDDTLPLFSVPMIFSDLERALKSDFVGIVHITLNFVKFLITCSLLCARKEITHLFAE